MRDENKTREQLISELRFLRSRIRQIEDRLGSLDQFRLGEPGIVEAASAPDDLSELAWDPTDLSLPVVEETEPERVHPKFLSRIDASPRHVSPEESSVPITESGSFDLRWISLASFGKLLHAVPISILLADMSGRIVLENYSFMTLSGELWSVSGESLYSLFPSRKKARHARSLVETVLEKRTAKVWEGCLLINGKEVWSRMHFRALRFGRERTVLVLIEDLTPEKREAALNAKYKTLVDMFPIGIAEFVLQPPAALSLSVDKLISAVLDAKLTSGNAQFAQMHGYAGVNAMRGLSCRNLIDATGAKFSRIRQWVSEKFPMRWTESNVVGPDGTVQYFETMIVGNLRDDTLREYWVMHQDITDHKRVQEELLEKIRTIDELYEHVVQSGKAKAISEHTATVAHELRQPLAIIGGFARRVAKECLSCDHIEKQPPEKWFGVIIREVQRLEKILEGLIDFSRREDIHLVRLDPSELIADVLTIYEERFKEKNLRVEFRRGKEPVQIPIDSERFQRVVRNLIANAVEASPANERILIETGVATPSEKAVKTGGLSSSTYFEIKVHNRGKPVPPHYLEKIFNPFFTTKTFGTGLGLTLSKKIVEDHNGLISVKSDDDGTQLTVWLPMSDSTREESRRVPPPVDNLDAEQ
ncbi:MAG: ATP-binding protein [Thermodesulfobacteriota bacterium]